MLLNLKKQVEGIHASFRGYQRLEWQTGITCVSFKKMGMGNGKMDQWVKALAATPVGLSSVSIVYIKM